MGLGNIRHRLGIVFSCVCVCVCFIFPFVLFSDTYLAAKPVYLTTQNRAEVKQRLWKF